MKVLFIGGTGNISARAPVSRSSAASIFPAQSRQAQGHDPGAKTLRRSSTRPGRRRRRCGITTSTRWSTGSPSRPKTSSVRRRSSRAGRGSTSSSARPPPTRSRCRSRHRVDAARQPVLGVLAQQDRLRGAPARAPTARRASRSPSCGRRTPTTDRLADRDRRLGDYTVVDRMRRGGQVIVHGDGTSLWTLTHTDDFAQGFVGLLGNTGARSARRSTSPPTSC